MKREEISDALREDASAALQGGRGRCTKSLPEVVEQLREVARQIDAPVSAGTDSAQPRGGKRTSRQRNAKGKARG